MKRIILLTLTLAGLFSLGLKNESMTLEEAVSLAETFVKDNGYTNVVVKNPKKLSYELFDNMEPSVDSILSRRYNTLQSKAFCYSRNENEWHIGFLYSSVNLEKLDSLTIIYTNLPGRAVIVNDNGQIRLAHKQPLFSQFTKIKYE